MHRRFYRCILRFFPKNLSSAPRKIFFDPCTREIKTERTDLDSETREYRRWRDVGERWTTLWNGSTTNRATEWRATRDPSEWTRPDDDEDPLFLEEGRERGWKNSYSTWNSIKLFLCRARATRFERAGLSVGLSRRPQREHKDQVGGDGGGFARDFVTSGRCFIDLNPLTGGTLRGYSPIVFTARDALEISSSAPSRPGEGDLPTYGAL